MGCWHGTCGLTQLPIIWQQKVKLFLLMDKYWKIDSGGGFCHSTEMYMPFYLPISGTYNDYGCIENIETDFNTDLIIKHFKNAKNDNTLIITELDSSELDVESIDSIVREVERGRIAFKNPVNHDKKILGMSSMMVLDDVYNLAIDNVGPVKTWWIGKKNIKSTLDDIEKNSIKAIKNTLKFGTFEELTDSYKKSPTSEKMELISSYFRLSDNVPWFSTSQSMHWVHDLLSDNARNGINLKKIMDGTKKLMMFNYFMTFSRKQYCPQAGAGSQNAEYELMTKFYKSVSEISAKIEADWKKECGE